MSNLNRRVRRARILAEEGKAQSYDSLGRVRTAIVPASQATTNHLIIRRGVGVQEDVPNAAHIPWLSVECGKVAGGAGNVECPGGTYHFCRHQIAAIFLAMWYGGFEPRFRKNFTEANTLAARAQDHGAVLLDVGAAPIIFRVKSHQGKGSGLWMVPLNKKRMSSLKRQGIRL